MKGMLRGALGLVFTAALLVGAAGCGDNGRAKVVQFVASESTGAEGTMVSLAVILSEPAENPVVVEVSATGNATSPAGPSDFELGATSVTIAAGSSGAMITLNLKTDSEVESDEFVVVSLVSALGARLGTPLTHTVKITDVAPMGATLAFASPSSAGDETSAGMVDVVRTGAVNGPASVSFAVTGGTASRGPDYVLENGTVSFAAGETRKSISMGVQPDTLDEPDETIELALTGPVGAVLGPTSIHTYTIRARTLPRVNLGTPTSSMSEVVTARTIPITLSAASAQAVVVNYTVGGTSTGGGVDHSLAAGTVTFAAGETARSIALPVINDTLDEPDETVIVTLTGANMNALLGTTLEHIATIEDDDGPPTVAFAVATLSSPEATAAPVINVTLSTASGKTVTVDYARTAGTASALDFGLAGAALVFNPGQTTLAIPLMVADDALDEDDETVVLTLGATPTNATLGALTTHTLTITDDDALPLVRFSAATSSTGEGNGVATVVVQLSAPSGRTVTVNYASTGGTAQGGGVDYTLAPGTLTFDPLETTHNITVTLIADASNEGNETVVIGLTTPTGANATLGTPSSHTLTLLDNLVLPTVQFAVDVSSISEGVTGGIANLTVTLSQTTLQTVTATFTIRGVTATAGTDFTAGTGTVTFTPGQLTRTIPVTIANDNVDEPDETLEVELSAPVNAVLGGITAHTLTIIDNDDTPLVTWVTSPAPGGNEDTVTGVVVAQLSRPSSSPLMVTYDATGGTATGTAGPGDVDYTVQNGVATFAPLATTANVSIGVVPDTFYENNETVQLTLSAPSPGLALGTPATVTYTIRNDDAMPVVDFQATASGGGEGIAAPIIVVRLSAESGLPVTVNIAAMSGAAGQATPGLDYTLGTSVSIPAGSTTANAPLGIIGNDMLDEDDEVVPLRLSGPVNATLGTNVQHNYTIQDIDAQPLVRFHDMAASGDESVLTISVAVDLTAASGKTITARVSNNNTGTATSGSDYNAPTTTLTFPPGTTSQNYTFTVINDGLLEADETVVLQLAALSNVGLDNAQAQHTYTINANDASATPTIGFSAGNMVGNESSAGNLQIVLVDNNGMPTTSGLPTTVNYAVVGGDATPPPGTPVTNPADHALVNGMATIPAGMSSVNVPVGVVDDALDEDTEIIVVSLSAPTNANLGQASTNYNIVDNDDPPVVSFVATTSSVDEDTPANVVVQLSAPSGRSVTVNLSALASAGGDYTVGGSITFPRYTTTANAPLTVTPDVIDEDDQVVTMTLSVPVSADPPATVSLTNGSHARTILDDDDPPAFSFVAIPANGAESVTTVNITITKTGNATERTFVVTYADFTATAGTATPVVDYLAIPTGTLSFLPNEFNQSFSFTVVDDMLNEPVGGDTVVIGITGVSNGGTIGVPNRHIYTIEDDDPIVVP